jgi:methionyl-tRNA formyltransferase
MEKLKIVFMGTPAFAVPSLHTLLQSGFTIKAVVTSPDKFGGRGGKQLLQSDIKKYAQDHGLPILQPTNLKDRAFLDELSALDADLFVVVAFRMLPEAVWSMPRLGTINLHGSLLPKYRGAAPINWAIIKGETETGLTTFLLDRQIDTGKILLQSTIPITLSDDAGSLHDKMMTEGAKLLLQTVEKLEKGQIVPVSQDERIATHAPKLFKSNTEINFRQPALNVYNFIRGLAPYPGSWTKFQDREMKIFESNILEDKAKKNAGDWSITNKKLTVSCEDFELEIIQLQPEGKRKMSALDFLNGLSGKSDFNGQ